MPSLERTVGHDGSRLLGARLDHSWAGNRLFITPVFLDPRGTLLGARPVEDGPRRRDEIRSVATSWTAESVFITTVSACRGR